MSVEAGSYRDPNAQVHRMDDRVFRVLRPVAKEAFNALHKTAFYKQMVDSGRLIDSKSIPNPGLTSVKKDDLVIEHPVIPLISYPYEWPFLMLKTAALHHIDLQIEALNAGFVLSDASAYNIQFKSNSPIFIDVTSIRPYKDCEPWLAHNQFCESFLAPLVLQARLGVSYQSWYRGNMEGIPVPEVSKLLRIRDYFSPTLLSHIVLPAALSRKEKRNLRLTAVKNASKGLPRSRYAAILQQLRHFIESLSPKGVEASTWAHYSAENTYLPHETKKKLSVVRSFCQEYRPTSIVDIGCNDGLYSACASQNGASMVIGLDADQGALHRAYLRSCAENLPFTPLYTDLTNPSPNQGFAEVERKSLKERLGFVDAVIALAVIHHLVIGRNIPLVRAVAWIVSFGGSGLIEFVPKDDQTIEEMLALREDIFPDYTRDNFVDALERHAKILSSEVVSESGRELFLFKAH